MHGLGYITCNIPSSTSKKEELFWAHFGSSSIALAAQWCDLHETSLGTATRLNTEEATLWGFKIKYCYGKYLWRWIEKIATLKEQKIVWDDSLDNPDAETFVASVD
eukprot:15359544-Ditylum_brightwellii.AAC.2